MQDDSNSTYPPEPPPVPYFIPRRPRVVKMRDLSPDTRDQLTREYFEAYDPWTGIRIAATIGLLISLFTLFLVYKSRFHRSRAAMMPAKKPPSLYLYEDSSSPDGSSGSSYGVAFACKGPDAAFQLEEVYVNSSVVALKVHPPPSRKRQSKSGPKFGTLRITEDTPRSLPCSPYKNEATPTSSDGPASLVGSIASFGSAEPAETPPTDEPKKTSHSKKDESKKSSSSSKNRKAGHQGEDCGKVCPKSMMVTAKKPQDYRSRSTVVSIARRQRAS